MHTHQTSVLNPNLRRALFNTIGAPSAVAPSSLHFTETESVIVAPSVHRRRSIHRRSLRRHSLCLWYPQSAFTRSLKPSSSIVGALSINPSALPPPLLPPRCALCHRATPRFPSSANKENDEVYTQVTLLPQDDDQVYFYNPSLKIRIWRENRDKQPIQFDPEIERTLRRFKKQSKLQQETLEEVSHQGSIMTDNENLNDNLNENQRRTLGDYTIPTTDSCGSSIVRPTVAANNFELKPSLIQLVQQDQ
ncbi:hypothetical protein PIB30_103608 [Stylosanthes scabra]|uniref:Uncharacterized protein n=1 Tax=Stylosanthes scabra TaxID=79078 RepID=A0ABU6V0M8_9FABA|nr:hypothetical protein [Stylosanthes scabra]